MKAKIILFVLAFTILYLRVFSYQDTSKMEEYYRYINIAETELTKNNYQEAVSNYYKAFNKYNFLFNKDANNLSVSAVKANNDSATFVGLSILVKRGYPIKYIDRDELFNNFKTTHLYNQLVKIDDYSYNKELTLFLDSIVTEDQKVRKESKLYPKYDPQIDYIDSMNCIAVLEYCKQNGFPDEKDIGLTENGLGYDVFIRTFIYHQNTPPSGSRKYRYDFSDYILEAIYEGKIDNKLGSDALERCNRKYAYCATCGVLKLVPPGVSEADAIVVSESTQLIRKEKLNRTNSLRKKIYLQPIKFLERWNVWISNYRHLGFLPRLSVETYFFKTQAAFNSHLSGIKDKDDSIK